ncbi:MAG: DUF6056 family protein [Muribaculum sp.]|nr:DUF6056 family protein [Muribaculum sp.]
MVRQDSESRGFANKTKTTIFWTILLGVTILCVWVTQREVPVMMDDEWYSTILSAEEPLTSLQDIVQAQIWHYNNWGGRTVAHTLAQVIFLYLSEPVADALNVAVILLLAWLINAMMGERRLAFVTLTIGFLHGLNANWKMSMYWQTGACNYLYMTVIILAFLWLYLRELDEETHKPIAGALVWVSLLGLLCGWTNENMGPAVWVLTVLVMLLKLREKKPVQPWLMSGSVFCLLGSVMMLLAPGNALRSAEVPDSSYGVLWRIFLRMYGVCRGAWEYLFPALLLTAALIFANVCLLGNRLRRKELLLLVGALLSWGAMVLSPHYPDRAAFGTMCLLLCVCVSQAASIIKDGSDAKCRLAMAGIGIFIWLRGLYFLGEFLAISWGWIR